MSCAFARTLTAPAAETLTVSVVMPTKNRTSFLVAAVRALLAQTVTPDELIVIDQSDDETSSARIAALVAAAPAPRRPRLTYILDRTINLV